MYNIDKLHEAVLQKGHVCVGLDTAPEYLPKKARKENLSDAENVFLYNQAIVDATIDVCACFKVQIAYYEALGISGLETYVKTLRYIQEKKGIVIADIKRGDIADTAERYAMAHFEGEFSADFVTLSPYMGMDAISPWLTYVERKGKGAFVLMRTSNPGMRDFEYQELKSGGRLYDAVGEKLSELADRYMGKHGYGAFGAVVGCTEQEEASAIREKRKNLFFLIPGYGAQGGAAYDAALLLHNGNGGVVNSSRAILKAWAKNPPENADLDYAVLEARKAVIEMRDAIRCAIRVSV